MDASTLRSRIDVLLERINSQKEGEGNVAKGEEVFNGTYTVMSAIYGTHSEQVKPLVEFRKQVITGIIGAHLDDGMATLILGPLQGALTNLKAELDADLIGSLRKTITGDLLTDFIKLARHVLSQNGEKAKNVASVLALPRLRTLSEGWVLNWQA